MVMKQALKERNRTNSLLTLAISSIARLLLIRSEKYSNTPLPNKIE